MKQKALTALSINTLIFLFGIYKTLELSGTHSRAFYAALIGTLIFFGLLVLILIYNKKHLFPG